MTAQDLQHDEHAKTTPTTSNQPGHAKAQPSGSDGKDPSTAGPGNIGVRSETPENKEGQIDPSAPGETGTTPGSNNK